MSHRLDTTIYIDEFERNRLRYEVQDARSDAVTLAFVLCVLACGAFAAEFLPDKVILLGGVCAFGYLLVKSLRRHRAAKVALVLFALEQ